MTKIHFFFFSLIEFINPKALEWKTRNRIINLRLARNKMQAKNYCFIFIDITLCDGGIVDLSATSGIIKFNLNVLPLKLFASYFRLDIIMASVKCARSVQLFNNERAFSSP